MNKKVQIIIPVLNRPELTRQTLKSLYEHTPADLYSLYVIDDASDDETKKVLESFNIPFLLTNHRSVGPGAARNMLIGYIKNTFAAGEYIYSSDNDVYFKEGWLQELIGVFEKVNESMHGKLGLLGASCHPYLQNNSSFTFEKPGTHDGQIVSVGIKDAVSGYSQLIPWEIWDKFGPFDEGSKGLEEKTGRSEDWALCRKMIDAGLLVGSVEPELVVPCGKTNTYGKPAVGQETFKNFEGVLIE